MATVYVKRVGGLVVGVFATPQDDAAEALADSHADVLAYLAPPTPARIAELTRLNALEAIDANALAGRIHRAFALLVMDELNLLRQQTVGVATAVWDPANMANATGVTSPNVNVPGAAFGDVVDVAAPYSLAGVTATAYVVAPDQVAVRLHNGTGAAVNLASGIWKVVVRRHGPTPDRNAILLRTAMITRINDAASQ